MSLSNYKLTDAAIAQKGVGAAPDRLTGSAAQNKAVFDRLIREAVQELFNGLIDVLASSDGAAEIGATAISGVTGADVQTVLGSLKTLLDTKSASADVTASLALKSDKAVTDLHLKSVSFDARTGVFTFTREDGSYVAIDTALEKVATNWQYDAAAQSLVLTLADGTTQSVPLSAFITETEFADSEQIDFSVSDHTVTATVKSGSITDAMLSSALVEQLRGHASDAASSAADALQCKNAAEGSKNAAANSAAAAAASATSASDSATTASTKAGEASASATAAASSASAADDSAEDSEAWAVGKRDGASVPSTDPAYHNNAKYWAAEAQAAAGGGVTSFNGRTGNVDPQGGDYTAAMVGADPAGSAAAVQGNLASHAADADIHVTAAKQAAWDAKQAALTFDAAPTADSSNPVTSGGVKTAIDATVTSFNSRTGAVTPQSGDYTAAMVGAQADLGFIEDTTYSGCLYRNVTVGGQTVREWVNPPLVADTEYRTTERFNGKPVYAKAYSVTDSSKLPSASNQVKNTNLSIANLETIISVTASGVWHNTASNLISHAVLPYRDILYAYADYGSNGSQYIEVMAGTLPANIVIDSVFAVIKYTKSTD